MGRVLIFRRLVFFQALQKSQVVIILGVDQQAARGGMGAGTPLGMVGRLGRQVGGQAEKRDRGFPSLLWLCFCFFSALHCFGEMF